MHFLNLKDLSKGQITELIQKAKKLKEENQYSEKLKGKFLGLIFEKASTRTRISFEVAMAQLGGIASFFPINDLLFPVASITKSTFFLRDSPFGPRIKTSA